MSQERTEAVVLRGVDFSETSRIITFLSPDRGRLTCMAKGVKRPKSPMAGLLDTYNRVEIIYYWKDTRSVQQLGEVSVLDTFGGIKTSLEKLTFAAFPVELVLTIAHENEPSDALYRALRGGFESLARWNGDVLGHVSWQAMRLMSAAGFEPALSECASCGGSLGDAPGFSFSDGARCRRCPSDVRLTREGYNELRRLVEHRDACPKITVGKEAFRVLSRFAARQLDTDFRSVPVIDKQFTE